MYKIPLSEPALSYFYFPTWQSKKVLSPVAQCPRLWGTFVHVDKVTKEPLIVLPESVGRINFLGNQTILSWLRAGAVSAWQSGVRGCEGTTVVIRWELNGGKNTGRDMELKFIMKLFSDKHKVADELA